VEQHMFNVQGSYQQPRSGDGVELKKSPLALEASLSICFGGHQVI